MTLLIVLGITNLLATGALAFGLWHAHVRHKEARLANPAEHQSVVTRVQEAIARVRQSSPLASRPDPTATYNIFRLDADQRLALSDEQRYSGNETERAEEAVVAYREDHTWTGTVYAFEGAECKYKVAR